MSKVLVIARREFVERVRTRGFWIGTVLFPVLMTGVVLIPIMLARGGGTKRIAVVDHAPPGIGEAITQSLDSTPTFEAVRVTAGPNVEDSLRREVGAKRLDGFLIVPADVIETGKSEYRASNVSAFEALEVLRDRLRRVVISARFAREGIDARVVQRAQMRIDLDTKKISRGVTTGESAGQSFALGYFMAILLYFAILVYGIGLMNSVLEEKTSKIVEVLVSSLKPFQLLAGKLIGVGGTSLFQFLIWAVTTRVLLSQRGPLMSRFAAGADPGAAGVFQLPPIPASTAVVFLFYFVGGFLLYAAMFAAVGAMSNSLQEAQQAQQPVTMLLVVSMVSLLAMITNPGSTYAVVMSLIPFSSPIAMPVRWVAGSVPVTEVVASMVLLVLGILAVLWIAGRIYRVGILMTGKRPSLRELVRWVRTA